MQHETSGMNDNGAAQRPVINASILGGGLVALVGAVVLIYALRLHIGSVTNMGPGFFPLVLGVGTVVVGVLNIVFGMGDTTRLGSVPWRPFFAVLASIGVFALLIRTAGLAPAAFCTAVVASFADGNSRIWQTLLLAAFLVAFSTIIFVEILGLPIHLVRIPVL